MVGCSCLFAVAILAIQPFRWAWHWFEIEIAKERLQTVILERQIEAYHFFETLEISQDDQEAEEVVETVEVKKKSWW